LDTPETYNFAARLINQEGTILLLVCLLVGTSTVRHEQSLVHLSSRCVSPSFNATLACSHVIVLCVAAWQCRVPMSADHNFYLPLQIPLWGIVEVSHTEGWEGRGEGEGWRREEGEEERLVRRSAISQECILILFCCVLYTTVRIAFAHSFELSHELCFSRR
jgi:hypothetical protein